MLSPVPTSGYYPGHRPAMPEVEFAFRISQDALTKHMMREIDNMTAQVSVAP
jgi:hypothetical protein